MFPPHLSHLRRSICLLLQAALPCLLYSSKPSKVTLKGGTNADMAPPIDYVTKVSENYTVIGSINGTLESSLLLQVFQPIAEKFGITFECQLRKRSATFHSSEELASFCGNWPRFQATWQLASFPGHVGAGLVPRPLGNWPRSQAAWQLASFPGHLATGLVPRPLGNWPRSQAKGGSTFSFPTWCGGGVLG